LYVYRIHIRPKGGSASMEKTFDYCLSNGVLGVGWQTETNRNTKDWDTYYDEASQIHDSLQICKYINKWVKEGDLVWTRDAGGQYYLSRVISGWEYWMGQEAINDDIDISNIFRVDLERIDIDQVPGKIVACFRARRAIQKVADKKAIEYSKHLWNKLKKETVYVVDKSKFSDIFMMLDNEETEDLVFLYLQDQGWYVLPNSRKADTMSFEYFLVKPNTGEIAVTQIKTGNTSIDRNGYAASESKVFLFQSNELYTGNATDRIICISRSELLQFMGKSINWLPQLFKRKIEMVGL
jgi:hypothetical protein